jgi:hypothetical protein
LSLEIGISFDAVLEYDEDILLTYADELKERNEQRRRANRKRR